MKMDTLKDCSEVRVVKIETNETVVVITDKSIDTTTEFKVVLKPNY